MFGIGASYVTCLIAVAYPAFMTFLALESPDEDDDKQWLTYWVVFGLFSIVD
jgi:receptor expression-enhancing protein 5/6